MTITNKNYTNKEIRDTDLEDSWWGNLVVKPISYRLTWLLANYTHLTPNQITTISFLLGLLAAYIFLNFRNYLIIGAIIYEISFIFDLSDGRIARLKGLQSKFGAYIDIMGDITKYFFIILGLVYGQYLLTNDISFLLYGYIFMFVELAFLANIYVIRHNQPESGLDQKDINKIRHETLKDKMPFFMNIKTKIDPNNKLSFMPLSSVEAETIVFFIAPIIKRIKLGIIFGTIIVLVNILLLIIFNFSMRKENRKENKNTIQNKLTITQKT